MVEVLRAVAEVVAEVVVGSFLSVIMYLWQLYIHNNPRMYVRLIF